MLEFIGNELLSPDFPTRAPESTPNASLDATPAKTKTAPQAESPGVLSAASAVDGKNTHWHFSASSGCWPRPRRRDVLRKDYSALASPEATGPNQIQDEMGSVVRNNWSPLSAAVLAGGKSTRMGTDKAMLPLVAGGPPLLAIVLEVLSNVADELLVVGGDRTEAAGYGARAIPDLMPGAAALGGIYSALTESRHEHCLVVACDMPFLSLPLLRQMASESRDYDVLVPELPGESRQGTSGTVYQTLHAIYSRTCVPAIEREIGAGRLRVIGFFGEVRVRTMPHAAVARHDPSLQSFFNANSPAALDQARAIHLDRLRLDADRSRTCA